MEIDTRFPTKLNAVSDAPEPLRSALVESLPSGEPVRLLVHAPAFTTEDEKSPATVLFHKAPVARDHVRIVINNLVAETRIQHPLGEGHTDGRCEALAEWTRRSFDPKCMAVFGVPGCSSAQLAKALQLFHSHVDITEQMMQRILQHRAVPGGEHKAVAVRPSGVEGIKFEEAGEENSSDVGHAQGHAGVAGFRPLHRIHGKHADSIGHLMRRNLARVVESRRGNKIRFVHYEALRLRSTSCKIKG